MRRALLTFGIVGSLTAAGLGVATTASAASAQRSIHDVVVRFENGTMHIVGGPHLPAGPLHFHVVSKDGKGHLLQIARLHKGYSERQLFSDAQAAFKGNTAAVRRLDSHVTARGGAEAAPNKPGDFLVNLPANRFLVFDQNGAGAKWVTVSGTPDNKAILPHNGNLAALNYGFGYISRNLPANGYIRLHDRGDEPHFFEFQRVRQSTTPAQVRAVQQQKARPTFLMKASTGSGLLSPHTSQVLHVDLPPGKYLVACFWPDDMTGMPHFFMGMWKLLELH